MNPGKKTRTIYLCGPIMDCSQSESGVWRERTKKLFSERFILLDPMRRNFKDREVDSANEIVSFDLQDIAESDILVRWRRLPRKWAATSCWSTIPSPL